MANLSPSSSLLARAIVTQHRRLQRLPKKSLKPVFSKVGMSISMGFAIDWGVEVARLSPEAPGVTPSG
jgi:hypothetical protein